MKYHVFIFFFLLSFVAGAQNVSDAFFAEVANSKEWLRLVHYRPALWGGYKSELDGEQFFFAQEGAINPEAELRASFKAVVENKQEVGKFKLLPRCAFPERSRFIIEKFQLNLPKVDCALYNSFLERFHDPQGVSLVFSSAYPNNPASMFGHTFLKINSARGTELLDTGVNFAAAVADDENPFAFAWFGVAGGYLGQWSTQPYYVKVREYINFESRDLWEYELNLTPEETQRLLAHFWELETNSYLVYYFFDENCSYQILKAIEAIKPEWTLEDHLIYLIPGESVKYALAQPGALKDVKYRPSLYKKMWQKFAILDADEKTQFKALIAEQRPTQELASRPVLDAAIFYLDYLKSEDKENFEKKYQPLQGAVLKRRAELGALSEQEQARYPEIEGTTRPDWGHDSYSFEGGVGHRQLSSAAGAETLGRLKIKSAYHDLLNRDLGYTTYAHIDFPSLELQYSDASQKMRIEEIIALATTSLTPVNELRTPVSYRMAVGLTTSREFLDCVECHQTYGEAGGGFTWSASDEVWTYGLLLARVDLGAHLQKGYSFGPGAELGILFNPVKPYKAQLELRSFCDLNYFDDCRNLTSAGFNQSLALGRNQELRNINRWVQPDHRLRSSYWESFISYIQFFN